MIADILQSEPRRKIWLYFLDLRIRYALALLFLGLVLAESPFGKLLLVAGLLWVLGALVLDRLRPSEPELDGLLAHEIEGVTETASRSHEAREGERRAAPIALLGPVEHDTAAPGGAFTRPRTGRDGCRRSPVHQVVVLLPLEDRLGIYSCRHDSLANRTSQIAAEEHHYRDVASVVLEKDFEAPKENAKGNGGRAASRTTQVLSLELTSGRRLSFPVTLARSVDGDGVPLGLERTVHALQALLRDHR